MSNRGCRLFGIISQVSLLLIGTFVLFFAQSHWNNWWSLFVFPALFFAILTPAICFNYDQVESLSFSRDQYVDEVTVRNYKECGWAMAFILLIFAYTIPVLAWYNAGMNYSGVLTVFGAITCYCFAYIFWLKIFVFIA